MNNKIYIPETFDYLWTPGNLKRKANEDYKYRYNKRGFIYTFFTYLTGKTANY